MGLQQNGGLATRLCTDSGISLSSVDTRAFVSEKDKDRDR